MLTVVIITNGLNGKVSPCFVWLAVTEVMFYIVLSKKVLNLFIIKVF